MMYDLKKLNNNHFLTHTKSLKFSKNFELKSGVDISRKKKLLFEKTYGLPAYIDLNEAVNKSRPELVVIATNEDTHFKILKKLINFEFIKYIILEKPGGKSYHELKRMFFICEKNNIRLFLNYFRMYDPYYCKTIKNIFFKKSIEVIANYKRGIANNCSHIINLMLMINCPSSIKEIKITSYKKHYNQKKKVLFVSWNRIKSIFINPDIKNFSFTKIQIFSGMDYLISNNQLSEFEFFRKKKSNMIKNNSEFILNKKIKNKNEEQYQIFFYDNFHKSINKYKYFKKIAMLTSYVVNKMSINHSS